MTAPPGSEPPLLINGCDNSCASGKPCPTPASTPPLAERVDKARGLEAIAADLIKCAVAWEPEARLVGNVRADEIARVVERHITSCPVCGSEPWVNIDCLLCSAMFELKKADQ